MLEEAIEAVRTAFPLALLAIFPVVVLVISPIAVVDAAHEFTVYRMQQYDLQGNSYGCRSALVSAEARTVESSSVARKCILLRSDELTHGRYLEILDRGPSSVVVLLHKNMTKDQVQSFISLESELLALESNIPVYFAHENDDLNQVYSQVVQSTKQDSGSALQALVDSATSVGYQLVTLSGQNKALPDQKLVNIQLLANGANSGSTGAVAMLELARILGKLYTNSRTHPRYNVLFLLSGGGKFNFQGSRKWIEDAGESTGSSTSYLNNAKLVLCLEALGGVDGSSLQMHVSKPPSKGSVAHSMYSYMEKGADKHSGFEMSLVHKKIRLASDSLSWEHERYSIRRLHAATLSSLGTPEDPTRRTILDTHDRVSVDHLVRNIGIIADAVVRQLYNLSNEDSLDIISGDLSVQHDRVQSLLEFLSSQPRPAQVLGEDHAVVTTLASELSQHVKGVQKVAFKADKRDPEFMFYDGLSFQMSASIVRSAVFDLYVTLLVAGYVTSIYFFVMKFSSILFLVKRIGAFQKIKAYIMRIDRTVPEAQRTGVSVYYDDYKKRLSVDVSKQSPTSAYRKNRPHPPKNFLEPHRSLSDPNLQFQHQLRKSVRKYVDELYNNAEGNLPNGEYIPQPKFKPERLDTSTPVYHRKSPQFYPCNQTLNISAPPLHITGYNCTRQPAETIRAEINPRLQGESKRERSVRITDEIRENTKLQTPEPQRVTWQAPRSPQPKHLQPHWVSPSKSKKRISSAPPGTNGFTHYTQHRLRANMEKYNDDMVANVEKWANTASNYEKQVIFKMLKQVSPNSGAPSTPMSFGNAGVPQNGGFYPHELPNEGDYYPELTDYSKPKKHRNLHSAPIKKMGGLVAHSTQHPTRDQRVYRLKGQDTRIDPSPQEERSLNGYMNQLQNRQLSYSKRDRKYARVPMHTHLPRQTTGAQDYQCKVSFFQSVRSPFKNHFVIHPDFTSESMTKRKPVSHTITHFRY